MDRAEQYADWIVKNADKRGTPEFETVARAYQAARQAPIPEVPADPPAVVKAGNALNDIPRQIGLTARYGMEGLGNMAQTFTEPFRYVTDRLTGSAGKTVPAGTLATQAADWMGLPKPQNATERVVGDATRMMAGAGGFAGAAQKAGGAASDVLQFVGKQTAPVVQSVAQRGLQTIAANPTSQLTAAAGGGLAGGASREAGGSTGNQLVSAVVGTVAGGLAPQAANAVISRLNAMRANPMQLEGKIALALRENGVDWQEIPRNIRTQLVQDVKTASSKGELNTDALRRLADFRMTGTQPTRGTLTLDPVQITREQNLAKMGANTGDGTLQGLARTQNQNNAQLVTNMNRLGAGNGSIEAGGQQVTSAILGRQSQLRGAEQAAWDAAKNSPGYRQPISQKVISDVNQALGDEGLMPFMNPTISKYMEAFQTGRAFTPQDYRNLQSMLSREVAKGGNEGAAANVARRVLERAEIQPITNPRGIDFGNAVTTPQTAAAMRSADAAPAASIDAVNQARAATRAAYSYEDSNPLVRSVLSGGATSDPVRIANRFVIGGTPDEARTMAREVGPAGVEQIKGAILAHLKDRATNGAADEVAKFSQSAFNRALNQIGDTKLRLFFSPQEIQQLKANARAASYMQVQPVGSAVNNSNSGALMLGQGYEWLNSILSKVPFGKQAVLDPLRSIDVSLSQRQAANIVPGLVQKPDRQLLPLMVGPGVAMGGGLLSAPNRP